jgi:predicted nucleic acid-binding protein
LKKSKSKPKHYCDSCVFIGFLNEEPDKFGKCKDILEAAEQDDIELYTSAFTMAEVIKIKNLTTEKEEEVINSLFLSPWINLVQFERETAEISRYLC